MGRSCSARRARWSSKGTFPGPHGSIESKEVPHDCEVRAFVCPFRNFRDTAQAAVPERFHFEMFVQLQKGRPGKHWYVQSTSPYPHECSYLAIVWHVC